jgi:hypothetical protein
VSNPSQADGDGDGAGDACDLCAGELGNDNDGDLICSSIDNCPAVPNANQANTDADPYGDACEVGVLLADVDLSGRVDGLDLAWLGRAFGSSRGGARYDAAVDLDRDGLVDGDDLALLAPEFGKSY